MGLALAAPVGVRLLIGKLDLDPGGIELGGLFSGVFMVGYYVVSFPIYFLNPLEHFLVSPWRYFFKRNWASDSTKPTWRVATEVITVVMYIVTTPLRLANAII